MTDRKNIVQNILKNKNTKIALKEFPPVFAPTNIALCKYWGKRDLLLNLPITSSLSISLGKKGTTTTLKAIDAPFDRVILNKQTVSEDSEFYQRLVEFLNLIPNRVIHFEIETSSNIPTAAGLASSASGFAALTLALNNFFQWQLTPTELSIMARLGSGSACRSIWQGFVEWHAGSREDGMDSFAEPINQQWAELCIGLNILSSQEKPIGSRDAMKRTVETSPFYSAWPNKVKEDLHLLKQAITQKDIILLGKTAESNALCMHATMMSTWPPVVYALPETISSMRKVWELRQQGVNVYFTQDAGPNIKLLFLQQDSAIIKENFNPMEILQPFN